MGAFTYETKLTSSISPAKMFKGFVVEADTIIPKVLPEVLKSVEIIEGDGGKSKTVKHKVEEVDKENCVYKYSIIEGDSLRGVIESITYVIKIVASPDGGSVCKIVSTYHTKGDAQINEEELKAGKGKAGHIFKAIEAYIHANPDY